MLNEFPNGYQAPLFSPIQFPVTLHFDHLNGNYNVLTHWHDEIEILYFKVGYANVICNQSSFSCKAGDVLFINSTSFHSLERLDVNCDYYCFSIGTGILKQLNSTPDAFPAFNITTEPHVLYALDTVIVENESKLYNYQSIVEMQISITLAYILRYSKSSAKNCVPQKKLNQYNKIRLAIEYIQGNLKNKISLDELCKITQFSTSQFSSLFKQYTGKTFVDYINLARCQYARSLFLTGKYSVTECAEMAGYNNLPYFARKYREVFGETLSNLSLKEENTRGISRDGC